jgi:hypothetical protein
MRPGGLALGNLDRMDRMEALTRGYWLRRALLRREPLEALRRDIERAHPGKELTVWQADVQCLPGFAAVRDDSTLRAAFETLFGGPVASQQGDICRVAFPGDATPAHQDQFFMKREDEVWAAWIPLADCSRHQGSLAVVSKSRDGGLLPHDPSGTAMLPRGTRWRTFNFRVGDVLFFHALTVHRTLVNHGPGPRISVDFRCSRR